MSLLSRLAYHQNGTLIDGRYRLLRLLGEGGMGCVWLAQHVGLDAPVALKLLKPDARHEVGAAPAEDLIAEAHITAQIRHPAVVSIFDSGYTACGDPFLAMEYLEGRVLADVLRDEGPIPASAAVQLMLPVVDALSLCHELGFVHRDVTPGNIFLARERGRTRTKLLDFGVARPASAGASASGLSGTPGYMAPEQLNGAASGDRRTDVWALCAVLYEAVAGRRAIHGNNCAELLSATLDQEVAPLQERGGGESSLWPIVERGLRKDPGHRYQSMRELHEALARWSDARPALRAGAASVEVAALHEPAQQGARAGRYEPARRGLGGQTTRRSRQGRARSRRVVKWVENNELPWSAAPAGRARSEVRRARGRNAPAAALLVLLAAATLRLTQ
jgi:eukaryotic-like serine/threonine-protein kinase